MGTAENNLGSSMPFENLPVGMHLNFLLLGIEQEHIL